MYDLLYSQTAQKQIAKLEQNIQERILASLERIRIRPFHFVKRLSGSPYHRLRIGDYRIILDIRQNRLIVFVIVIGHRKDIYK